MRCEKFNFLTEADKSVPLMMAFSVFLWASINSKLILLLSIVAITRYIARWRWEHLRWLFNGPGLLAEKYVSGKSFTIQTPERNYTVVSSETSIRELASAKEEQMSLVATAEEVFQPAYTMNGVELNQLGMQHRILRSLSLKLPSYIEPLSRLAREALSTELGGGGGTASDEWASLSIWHLAQNVIGKANTYTFYGDKFTKDSHFLAAAVQYPQDVFVAAEALRCMPAVLSPLVASLVTRGHRASKLMLSRLLPMIEARIVQENDDGIATPREYVDYVVKLYPDHTSDRAYKIAQQTLALWFAGVHQPAIALFYATIDLCTYPEYIPMLREEIQSSLRAGPCLDINNLPILDSFLKESARMNASESSKSLLLHSYHLLKKV